MYVDGSRLVLSPSDLVAHLQCAHLTELALEVAQMKRPKPPADDPELTVVQERGLAHERAYLDSLTESAAAVLVIDAGSFETDVRATLDALKKGPDVIYQAAFFDGGVEGGTEGPAWRGHADFLHRRAVPSDLGDYSYEPADTKLARNVKPGAVIQLCEYAAQLARLQGRIPTHVHVVLGGKEKDAVTLRLGDFAAYHRAAKRRFEEATAAGVTAYPLPNQHCSVCPWHNDCEQQWERDDHLVRVAGLSVEQAKKLQTVGIETAAALADLDGSRVPGIAPATLEKLRAQARLQHTETADGRPAYELLETAADGFGLGALPPPSAGDLFFDIEGDPFVDDAGIEYLLGVGWAEPDGSFGFRAFWSHDAPQERAAFEAFIDFVMARRAAHPDLHVFHFAPYETTAVGKLMGRYGTREDEVDELLRAGVFVDLHRVVRQGVRVGTPSYSLKQLEALYMEGRRRGAIVDAGSSIVEYERWLQTGDDAILVHIEAYNRTDCESTRMLRDWLEPRRDDYAVTFGTEPPRPSPRDGAAPEGVQADAAEAEELAAALCAPEGAVFADEARQLLAHLLGWHRREAKPGWWAYYHRVNDCDLDDLFEDSECIAGLEYLGTDGPVARSVVYRYRFDPSQEHKFGAGDAPVDPERVRAAARDVSLPGAGTIESIDQGAGVIRLRRRPDAHTHHPRALIPPAPIGTDAQRDALRRLARDVADHGIDGAGRYRAARDLLLRRPPRRKSVGPLVGEGEAAATAAVRLAGELDGGCLAIQGPPGSGKTDAAARIAVELLRRNERVGVTALSHAAITNLLRSILRYAEEADVEVRCSQQGDRHQVLDHPKVRHRSSAAAEADLAGDTNLFAGTSWLFSREGFDGALDYLIVDEAGQLSLADTLAVATSTKNLVLVGDPRQLAQPSQGTHPDGAGLSALEHLLGGHDTMPETLGIFLDHTHRLHPGICAFVSEIVYEDRLQADPECARQRVDGPGAVRGSGLRWHSVGHVGNRTSSQEEAGAVASLYGEVMGQTFTDRGGKTRKLSEDDVLVVAPYNAQVSLIAAGLPAGARVGTVDKFQGQEAPVVIVSLATSSREEIPRGMEFLYSRNRLNVAVSRAQALAIVVTSPALLSVRCDTVAQLRLANGLCRLAELATPC